MGLASPPSAGFRAVRAALLLGALLAGCVSQEAAAPVPSLLIESHRARVVVPDGATVSLGPDGGFTRNGVTVRCREFTGEAGGTDFSVVAEGEVHLHRFDGKRTFTEGPYRVVVYRNGQVLTR